MAFARTTAVLTTLATMLWLGTAAAFTVAFIHGGSDVLEVFLGIAAGVTTSVTVQIWLAGRQANAAQGQVLANGEAAEIYELGARSRGGHQ